MDDRRGLRGSVRTKDGWAVRHAVVTVTDLAGRQVAREQTGEDGVLAAGPLPAGTYTVIVTAMGFQPTASTLIVHASGAADLGTLVLARAGGTELPPPGPWTIDPAHSSIMVTVRHLGLSSIHGRFGEFGGRIDVAEPVERSRVSAEIKAATLRILDAVQNGQAVWTGSAAKVSSNLPAARADDQLQNFISKISGAE